MDNEWFITIDEARKITGASWGTVQTWCTRRRDPVRYKIEPAKEGGKDQWLVWLQDILDYYPLFLERKAASGKALEGAKAKAPKEPLKPLKPQRPSKAVKAPQPKPVSDERQLLNEWGIALEAILVEANDRSPLPSKVKVLCEEVARDLFIQREATKLRREIEAWESALTILRGRI